MRRKEERSKQGQTNNKAKQHSTCTITYMYLKKAGKVKWLSAVLVVADHLWRHALQAISIADATLTTESLHIQYSSTVNYCRQILQCLL